MAQKITKSVKSMVEAGYTTVFLGIVTFVVLARRGDPLVAGDIRAEGR